MSKMELYGPFDVDVKVYCTDGEQVAVATYGLGRSTYATPENVPDALAKVEAQMKEQMGDEWRLCTKREYFDHLMTEMTGSGERFALPGGDDWDDPPMSEKVTSDE